MSLRAALCGTLVAFVSAVAVFAATPRPLGEVIIPTPNAKPINLKDYRGKVVLLAVILTDCPPCVKSIDILNRAQTDFGKQGFQVIAVAGDPNVQFSLGAFAQRYRPNFPLGYLNQDQIIRLGDFSKNQEHAAPPIFMFIDRKGIVRQQVAGNEPFFKTEEASTRQTIQSLLKQP